MSGLILLKAAIKVSAKGSPNRKVCQANEIYWSKWDRMISDTIH